MRFDSRRRWWEAVAIAVAAAVFMFWLRLVVYRDTIIPLTYVLPLLASLWHRDRRFHWALAAVFAAMATYKVRFIVGDRIEPEVSFWLMQLLNIGIAAVVIDLANVLRQRLEVQREALAAANVELQTANEELAAREEEISRQNEELQQQSEELEQQTEELTEQTEELQQQGEEMQAQTEELRELNDELSRKETTLQSLLEVAGPYPTEDEALERIVSIAPYIVGADAGAILSQTESGYDIRSVQGFAAPLVSRSIARDSALADIVLEQGQVGFLADIDRRPDLTIPQPATGERMRAIACAPFPGLSTGPAVVLEVYGAASREWSAQQLRLLEWLAAQGAHVLEIIRLQEERSRAESTLRQLNTQLEQRVAERTALADERAARLQALAVELTQVERRERRRLAKLLHDHLQQILAAAKLHAGLVRRKEGDEASRTSVRMIDELLQQAIDTSRTLTVELSPAILNENGIAAGLAWLARSVKEKHDLAVNVSIPDGIEIQDENLRTFVFESVRELLFNVTKHAGMNLTRVIASVELASDEKGETVVCVTDNGQGCELDEQHLVNQAGFGLFGIQQRVQHLGGEFSIWSRPGQGLRVRFTVPPLPVLPTAVPHPNHDLRQRPAARVSRKEQRTDESVRVLLVDDHAIVRQGLASVLETDADIRVIGEAADGLEAIDAARDLRPDVIVMDISMPQMDGIEATRRILAEFPDTCVIGLSMYEENDLADAMRAAGAKSFFSKDAPAETLIAAIRRVGPAARTDPLAAEEAEDERASSESPHSEDWEAAPGDRGLVH